MGYGTEFNAHVFINRRKLKTHDDADFLIGEAENDIDYVKEKLISMLSIGLNTGTFEDMDNASHSIMATVDDLIAIVRDASKQETEARLFKSSLDSQK